MPKPQLDPAKVNFIDVDEGNDGQRLDNFLLSLLKGAPKTLVYRIIRKGEVRINKGRKPTQVKGDRVQVLRQAAEANGVPDVSPALQKILKDSVLFEDDVLPAINKPMVAVHGGSGVSLGLIEALRKVRPDHNFLELVHRLDRDTSGVILIAKKRKALTALQQMLVDKRGISKKYLALVHGHWDPAVSDIRLPLLRTERQSGERIVVVSEEGKSCPRTQATV